MSWTNAGGLGGILFDSDGRGARRMTGTNTEFGVQCDSWSVEFGNCAAILRMPWGFRFEFAGSGNFHSG